MPRDSNGNYSLPIGTIVSTGDTILPSQHNPAFQDVATALTNSMPKSGGTFGGPVSFAAGISGDVNFPGMVGAQSVTTSGALGVGGQATFGGVATFQAGVNGPVTFNGAVGAASLSTTGPLGVTGTATLQGAMNVGGLATFANSMSLTGSMAVGGSSTFGGAVTLQSGVNGPVTFNGTISAANATIGGTLGVSGQATFAGAASFPAGITGPVTFGSAIGAPSISTSGALGVGTTLSVGGAGSFGGNVTAASFTPTSDERIKTQIEALDPAAMMAALKAIGGKHYLKSGTPEMGVIAQDVQAVLPDLVGMTFDGMCTVNYNGLVAALIAAIVGLDARVRTMEDAA